MRNLRATAENQVPSAIAELARILDGALVVPGKDKAEVNFGAATINGSSARQDATTLVGGSRVDGLMVRDQASQIVFGNGPDSRAVSLPPPGLAEGRQDAIGIVAVDAAGPRGVENKNGRRGAIVVVRECRRRVVSET